MAKEWQVKCKRCGEHLIGYSDMMYDKMAEAGQSRPEYCDICRPILLQEKMTMGAAYFSAQMLPGEDINEVIPGELGKVYHDPRPHTLAEKQNTFDASKFGATPDKVVELYQWLRHKNHQVAIIIGPTGSGKSTALPYWLIYPPEGVPSDFFTRNGQILITQPRIVATTSIAEYMGVLLGSSVGRGFDIGYRYSKDHNADRYNAAYLATDGTLINMIKNGQLADISTIIIDEAHERSLNIDIILRLLKDQLPLYPHLKLLIVSATINKELFLNFFGEKTAKIIEFEAKRKFDYQVFFADESEKLPYDKSAELKRVVVSALARKTLWLLNEMAAGRKTPGHILAFLQGVKPIEEAVALLRQQIASNSYLRDSVEVFPLYSDLPPEASSLALKGQDQNKVRVVVCTNIAEASVTVEGTVYVVESGIENQAQWDTQTVHKHVGLTLISQANARQRWGRSGRTAPGEVHCLYTQAQFEQMIPFPIPAIQRSSMEDIILILKDMGVDDLIDGWIESPHSDELQRSYSALQTSGALDEDGLLTEYGALLHEFQYTATLTDLIILSDRFGCAVEVATLLPLIKNNNFHRLLRWDDNWDRQTKKRVQIAHQYLLEHCHDDVEFALMIYALWENPPQLPDSGTKKLSVQDLRQIWSDEYFVNFDLIEEDVESERTSILSLLTKRRKDHNHRYLDLNLINRVKAILAYCVPYAPIEGEYQLCSRSETLRLQLQPEIDQAIKSSKQNRQSYVSLAVLLADWETRYSTDFEAQLLNGTDQSLQKVIQHYGQEWLELVQQSLPTNSIVVGTVRSVVKTGVFVTLPENLEGFVHISQICPTRRIDDATTIIAPNTQWHFQVIGYDAERSQIQLSLKIPENSPLNRYQVGQELIVRVTNIHAELGAFVEMELGYSGLIHITQMGRRVRSASELMRVGDMLKVKVVRVGEKNGQVKTDLALIENLIS